MRARLTRVEQVGKNRASVLDAARRVFLARGYGGATLEAIAEEAGFSKGVVYSQFASKADLFLALLEGRIAERAAENERIAGRAAGAAALRALLRNFEADVRAEAGWARLVIEFRVHALRDPALNRRYAEAHARTVDLLAGALDGIHRRGGLEPAMPPRAMAGLMLAVGAGVTLERAADPGALPWPVLSQMAMSGLGLAPPGERSGARLKKVAR
jgi:AcrR family transcriptional regulator